MVKRLLPKRFEALVLLILQWFASISVRNACPSMRIVSVQNTVGARDDHIVVMNDEYEYHDLLFLMSSRDMRIEPLEGGIATPDFSLP